MRLLFIHSVFLLSCITSLIYIEHLKKVSQIFTPERSIAKDIYIRVFGEGGEEWKVSGKELISFGEEINLIGVVLQSTSGYLVSSRLTTLSRNKNTAILEGSVLIEGNDIYVRTERAVVDFNKNTIYGDSDVEVRKGNNLFFGRSFRAYLKPFRVIIEKVKTKHEV